MSLFALCHLCGPAPAFRDCMILSTPTDLHDLPAGLSTDVVEALAARSVRRDSVASFQALLAALAEAVAATQEPAVQAEAGALSLRQRETVAGVRAHLEGILEALAAGVSAEGQCLKRTRRPADVVRAVLHPTPGWLPRRRTAEASAAPPTWVAAAGAAVEAIGQTAAHAQTLADAQPEMSSARVLGSRVAQALLADRDAMLADLARFLD